MKNFVAAMLAGMLSIAAFAQITAPQVQVTAPNVAPPQVQVGMPQMTSPEMSAPQVKVAPDAAGKQDAVTAPARNSGNAAVPVKHKHRHHRKKAA